MYGRDSLLEMSSLVLLKKWTKKLSLTLHVIPIKKSRIPHANVQCCYDNYLITMSTINNLKFGYFRFDFFFLIIDIFHNYIGDHTSFFVTF